MPELVAKLLPHKTGLDPQLRKQLTDVIYVAKPLGYDEFGNPVYGEPKPEAARRIDFQKKITDKTGQEVVAAVEVLTDAEIGLQDRIWLPDGDPDNLNDAWVPRNRQTLQDERGRFVATRVWLGWPGLR